MHTNGIVMRNTRAIPLLLLVALLAGCAMIEGQYYLNSERYEDGRKDFAPKLAQSPNDPQLNYYMARFELGAERPDRALPYIQKAVALVPDKAEYRFWEGVTWWALQEPAKERAAYEKALVLDPDLRGAQLYLAHNLLDAGDATGALRLYDKVLARDPYEPQAMFNRAVALERLGRAREMRTALLAYMELYPDGAQARQGAQMLNLAGDYTWRNHVVGLRTVTLRSIDFSTGGSTLTEDACASLDVIGSVMSIKRDFGLDIVVFVKGDAGLARKRALAVREYITRMYPQVAPNRVFLSWFGAEEAVKAGGKAVALAESVNLFTRTN